MNVRSRATSSSVRSRTRVSGDMAALLADCCAVVRPIPKM